MQSEIKEMQKKQQIYISDYHEQFEPQMNVFVMKPDSFDFQKNLEFSKSGNMKSIPSSIIGYSAQAQNVSPPFHNILQFSQDPNYLPAQEGEFGIPLKINNTNNTQDAVKLKRDQIIDSIDPDEELYPMLYQFWPSKNRIYFKGYLFTGPKTDSIHNAFTWLMIILPSICFFVLCAPFMWVEVGWIYVIVIAYLFINTLAFLCCTQFSDPGIVPRQEIIDLIGKGTNFYEYLDNVKAEFQNENKQQSDTGGCPLENDNKKKKKFRLAYNQYEIKIYSKNTTKIQRRICSTCKIVKQPRMSHCNECGNCVQVFDHHCPFVNNCIGKRNYKYFLCFLVSLLLLGLGELGGFLMIFIMDFGEGIDSGNDQILVQNQTILVIILCLLGIPTVFFTICVFILACFHTFLVAKGKTTKEKLGKSQQKVPEQLDHKIPTVNWCTSDPSLFNLRQRIKKNGVQFVKNEIIIPK